MTFVGDSVTAGFGYCGVSENADDVDCKPNQPMADSWFHQDTSLNDCKPPAVPNDACSNDNYNGKPWLVPPWSPGPKSPDVAYPYQVAASQSARSYAAVSDWAMTGATPADWDPADGRFGPELRKIDDQYVVMTLGANPILSDFTDITYAGITVTKGPCVDSTGYESRGVWYSGPLSTQLACVERRWTSLDQTQHLVDIYKALLSQDDHVMVLGYYRACSWSFGNWQPAANVVKGPSKGYKCTSESRPTSKTDHARITQWDQAVAVGNDVNSRIHAAVVQAQDWAKREWPGTKRYADLAWTSPDETAWAQHQPLSSPARGSSSTTPGSTPIRTARRSSRTRSPTACAPRSGDGAATSAPGARPGLRQRAPVTAPSARDCSARAGGRLFWSGLVRASCASARIHAGR